MSTFGVRIRPPSPRASPARTRATASSSVNGWKATPASSTCMPAATSLDHSLYGQNERRGDSDARHLPRRPRPQRYHAAGAHARRAARRLRARRGRPPVAARRARRRAVRMRPGVLRLRLLAGGRRARVRRVEPGAGRPDPGAARAGGTHPAHPPAGPLAPARRVRRPGGRLRLSIHAAVRGRRGGRWGDRRGRLVQAQLARVLPALVGRHRPAGGARRPGQPRGRLLVDQGGAAAGGRGYRDDPVPAGARRAAVERAQRRVRPAAPDRRAGVPAALRGTGRRPGRGTARGRQVRRHRSRPDGLLRRRYRPARYQPQRGRQPDALHHRRGTAAPRRRVARRPAAPAAPARRRADRSAAVRLRIREALTVYPSIGVVVPTRNRPGLLRRTLAAIAEQDYPGRVSTVVVYDQSTPDPSLPADQVLTNARTAGLAGARNTGILALDTDGLDTELVAFCDDDDEWAPDKLSAQVAALEPGTDMMTCAIEVRYRDRAVPRL